MKTHGKEVEETEEITGDTNESFLFHNSSARFISLQNAARERKFLSRTLEVKILNSMDSSLRLILIVIL